MKILWFINKIQSVQQFLMLQKQINLATDIRKIYTHKQLHYVDSVHLRLVLQQQILLSDLMLALQRLYQQFTDFAPQVTCEIVPTPTSKVVCEKHSKVALGGTFDRLHSGHRMLLTYAALLLRQSTQANTSEFIVGITEDSMLLKKSDKEFLQSYYTRRNKVGEFLSHFEIANSRLFRLYDGYGPTIIQEDITGLVVTQETISGGTKISQIRASKNLKPLQVYVMELIEDPDAKNKISSTGLRTQAKIKNRFSNQSMKYYIDSWNTLFNKTLSMLNVKMDQQKQDELRRTWFERVFDLYSQDWRYYHTNQHIKNLLKRFYHQKPSGGGLTESEILVIEWSIWFHDVVYYPPAKDNEEKSAELFQVFFKQIIDNPASTEQAADIVKNVIAIILSTKTHKCSSRLEKLFSDLDMFILDAEWPEYFEYSRDIQKQYGPLFEDSKDFCRKRLQFLQSLDPVQIFYFHKSQNLQSNLQKEITMLTQIVQK